MRRMRHAALVFAAAGFGIVAAGSLKAAPVGIAIPEIGFTDSSGEARDQQAEHEARRRALTDSLRTEVGQSGRLDTVVLSCDGACDLDAAGVEKLRQRAHEAGAAFILVGKVYKVSTLVLSMRVAVLDAASGQLVLERLLSFRGDNDEAWHHAADYVAREVTEKLAVPN